MKNSKFTELFKKLFDKFGFNIFIILGLLGVILIFLSEFDTKKVNNDKLHNEVEDYEQQIKTELESILSTVDGAGDVKVMLTIESGQENIYACQEKTSKDEQSTAGEKNGQRSTYENEVVMVTTGSEKQALVEKTMQPAVQGVVVVCQGADNIKVTSDITNAVSVVLNIPTNRICVIKMK